MVSPGNAEFPLSRKNVFLNREFAGMAAEADGLKNKGAFYIMKKTGIGGGHMKNVIHIFGASGAGTTTLGRKIASELGYFFMDTDDYFWLPTDIPFTVKRPAEERLVLMKRDIDRADNVVLSGSLTEWGDVLMPLFTLAVRIETETSVRIERLKARESARFADRIREGGDMHKEHLQFLDWAAGYDDGDMSMRSKIHHDAWQERLSCPLLTLDGANDPEDNFSIVKSALYNGDNV